MLFKNSVVRIVGKKLMQTSWKLSHGVQPMKMMSKEKSAKERLTKKFKDKLSSAKLTSAMNIWKLKWSQDFNAATQTRMLSKEKYA
jgi:hypothetical protein